MKRLITNNYEPVNRNGLVLQLSYRKTDKVAVLGTFKDYSGNANNGTLYGNALANQNGVVFDRTANTYMKCSPGAMTTRTMMFNLKLNDYELYWYDCVTRDGSGYQGFVLGDNASDESSPYLRYAMSNGSNVHTFGTLSIGTKTALALTTDGATMSLYQDGICVASNITYSNTQTADIYFGATTAGSNSAAIELDDIMIFDRILPAGEIKANYLKNKRN